MTALGTLARTASLSQAGGAVRRLRSGAEGLREQLHKGKLFAMLPKAELRDAKKEVASVVS